VRRVIELATPHLVSHWPEAIRTVVLATGEAPEAAWLRRFRKELPGVRSGRRAAILWLPV